MKNNGEVSGIFGKSTLVAFVSFLAKGASFLAMALVARTLSPVHMGFLDLAIFIFMSLLPLAAFNIHTASVILISTHKQKQDLAFSVFVALAVFYAVVSVLGFFVLPYILGYLDVAIEASLLLIALASFLFVMHTFVLSAFQGLEDFRIYSLLLSLQPIIFLATQIFGRLDNSLWVLFSSSVDAVLTAYMASYFVPVVIAFYLLLIGKKTFEFTGAIDVFKYGAKRLWWPVVLGAVVGFYLRALIFVDDPTNNAIVRILDQYSQLVIIPASAFVTVIFPKLTQVALKEVNYSVISAWMRKYVAVIILAGFLVTSAGIVFLPLIFGNNYQNAIPFLGLYGSFIIISLISSFIGQLSLANKRWTYLWVNTAVVLNFANLVIATTLHTFGVLEIIGIYIFNSAFAVIYFLYSTRQELGAHSVLLKQTVPLALCFAGLLLAAGFPAFAIIIAPIFFALVIVSMHIASAITLQELGQIFITMVKAPVGKLRELPELLKIR